MFREPLADDGERRRLAMLARVALRADATAESRAEIAALLARDDWRPARALPPMEGVLLPLVHNVRAAGCDAARALDETAFVALPGEAHFREAGFDLVRRRKALADLGAAARGAGIGRLLLVKGAAIAARFASPALRPMTDIDVVAAPEDRERLGAALSPDAFAPVSPNAPHARRHRATGVAFEFTVASSPFARAAFDRAESATDACDPFAAPRDADHLVIVARHAAQHLGARIWRDILDARTLLASADVGEALDVARAHGAETELRALLRFVGEMTGPDVGVDRLDGDAEAMRALYEAMAFVPVPTAGLKVLRRFLTEGASPADAIAKLGRDRPQNRPGATTERDFGLGRVPASFAARQAFKAQMAAGLLLSGKARHYVRILRMQTRARSVAGERFFADATWLGGK